MKAGFSVFLLSRSSTLLLIFLDSGRLSHSLLLTLALILPAHQTTVVRMDRSLSREEKKKRFSILVSGL